jgi:hypothetical protein
VGGRTGRTRASTKSNDWRNTMTKLEKGRVLKVDEKWSITYDPDNNDRPLKLFRYDVDTNVNMHDEKNYVLAMFYRILELENSS